MKRLKIAVVTPKRDGLSETFIKAHIAKLPFEIVPIYGMGWRRTDRKDRYLWPTVRPFGEFTRNAMPEINGKAFSYLLSRYLKKMGVDGVLAEYGHAGTSVMDACRLADKPLFVHFHGGDAYNEEIVQLYRNEYIRMFSFAKGIVAVSGAMYRQLIGLGAPEERLLLNRYGVDPERFYGAEPENAEPVFFAVGRFVEKKAPHLTVLAFSRVAAQYPGARLKMAGGGPLLGPAKRMAEALGIDGQVDFLGPQPPESVSRLMKEARAFVQHSLTAENGDSEGTPLAVIEAQMTGLPVVSTYHAGIPDVVVNDETGFLVPEAAVDEMGDCMLKLARDSELAGKMGRAGRQRALAHFTLERHLGELAQMIEDGIGTSKQF